MPKKTMIPAAIAGVALVGSLAAVNVASAGENPFAAKPLDSGYMQLAGETGEGKCGEGKCGEGKCGEGKGMEGKCGEGKETKEGKCGEGKCGGK
jgi:uncharacterized low-complexity protein